MRRPLRQHNFCVWHQRWSSSPTRILSTLLRGTSSVLVVPPLRRRSFASRRRGTESSSTVCVVSLFTVENRGRKRRRSWKWVDTRRSYFSSCFFFLFKLLFLHCDISNQIAVLRPEATERRCGLCCRVLGETSCDTAVLVERWRRCSSSFPSPLIVFRVACETQNFQEDVVSGR